MGGRCDRPYLQPGQTILMVTKGLESSPEGELMILPDVLASQLPDTVRSSPLRGHWRAVNRRGVGISPPDECRLRFTQWRDLALAAATVCHTVLPHLDIK